MRQNAGHNLDHDMDYWMQVIGLCHLCGVKISLVLGLQVYRALSTCVRSSLSRSLYHTLIDQCQYGLRPRNHDHSYFIMGRTVLLSNLTIFRQMAARCPGTNRNHIHVGGACDNSLYLNCRNGSSLGLRAFECVNGLATLLECVFG